MTWYCLCGWFGRKLVTIADACHVVHEVCPACGHGEWLRNMPGVIIELLEYAGIEAA